MKDLCLFILRLTLGGLLAGHGAQKLFGAFGGHGLQGTGGYMEGLGLRPGQRWALAAGSAEFGGGLLTAFGLGGPIGPISTLAPMATATGTVHWGKPIWTQDGGPELPLTNAAIASALALCGPGRLSLDHLFGIRLPWWMGILTLTGTAAGVSYALTSRALATLEQEQTAPLPADESAGEPAQVPLRELGAEERPAA
jgi:putative oxidoreductase